MVIEVEEHLQPYYETIERCLMNNMPSNDAQFIEAAQFIVRAGIPFLYICVSENKTLNEPEEKQLTKQLKRTIEHVINDTILTYQCEFFRQSQQTIVYKCQLIVPNKKYFCCGNMCPDCILNQS